MANHDGSKGCVAGLMLAAAVGTALGVLYAPRSGKETMTMIKERFTSAKDKIVETSKNIHIG